MSYGTPKWQSWVKGEEESLDLIKKAYDAGINFFDTANVYSAGVCKSNKPHHVEDLIDTLYCYIGK
jgi:aryl-alcohol dehydrogenase-like predicted oxidoreductase